LPATALSRTRKKPARWLLRASYRGEPSAEIGWLRSIRAVHGVPADMHQANHWYGASAKQGNRYAMHRLGVANFRRSRHGQQCRRGGALVHPGSPTRIDGFANSILRLLYERGMGVMQSLPDAYKWYTVAAAQGDKEAAGTRCGAVQSAEAGGTLAEATRASAEFSQRRPT